MRCEMPLVRPSNPTQSQHPSNQSQASPRHIIIMSGILYSQDHYERIVAMNDNNADDMFLDEAFLRETVLPNIVKTSLTLTVLYMFLYCFVASRLIPNHATRFQTFKVSYQLTNLLTNLTLGLFGLYASIFIVPSSSSIEEQVSGFRELYYFSTMQLGYQLWAIPLGFSLGEKLPMIVHHFTVIIVASMSGFLTNGFRYWTPFFYGVIELSSVPLAIMNAFKDNRSLIAKYPNTYSSVRLIFAALFLYIRIFMFVPRNIHFLRDHFILFSNYRDNLPYVIFMGSASLSSFLLLLLQLYWGSLILKGLLGSIRRVPTTKQC